MRTVKHFSLDRINGTEIRTIADVEEGVLALMEREETVIRRFKQAGLWRHRRVMLFVMEDLQPLVRQVQARPGMTAERIAAIQDQPATVLYDLKAPDECSVFVNRQAAERAGYWRDLAAMEGLLAHEHAHPAAENDTVRASRHLQLDVTGQDGGRLTPVVRDLARKLSLYAPRELFANETALRAGCGDALLHLDERLINDAARSLAGRAALLNQVSEAVSRQALTQADADALLLAGDLQMCLPLAIEVAPFNRARIIPAVELLKGILASALFPALGPRVEATFGALCDAYAALSPNLGAGALAEWCRGVVDVLARALGTTGYSLCYEIQQSATRDLVERP
jgi:hypothetical protein